jgi:myo-inositol-1(or 4)-monophosphatase
MTGLYDKEPLGVAIKAAVKAGKFLATHSLDMMRAVEKETRRDLVTNIDLLAEEMIREELAGFSRDIPVVGEELGGDPTAIEKGECWIVDPIDGTVNFVCGFPYYGCSVAYFKDGEPCAGAVFNSASGDIYYGGKGYGAFRNIQKIHPSAHVYRDGLFAASFSGRSEDPDKRAVEYQVFGNVNDSTRGCLRLGSAALNICGVLEGRFAGAFGFNNKVWDIAGSLAIAGGTDAFVQINGPAIDPRKRTFMISNRESAEDLRQAVMM